MLSALLPEETEGSIMEYKALFEFSDEQKTKIKKEFVEQVDKEIETIIEKLK